MQKPDMTWEKITATNKTYTTATNKAVNTNGFILNQIRYYNTTATKANGAHVATNTFSSKAASVNLAYSTNCGIAPDWHINDYIYLVGTIGADGLFYLDTTQWWSNALPSTNDGKLYIRIGVALDDEDATASFLDDRPIFYHNGTKICEYKVADNKQDALISGTNIKTINNQSLLGSGNIDIQGGGSIYTAGTGIDITNDVISVADPVLKNTATGNTSLTIGSSYPTSASTAINIGELSQAVGNLGTAVGYYSYAQSQGTALGYRATANTTASVAVGTQAYANGTGSIQIGKGTNSNNYSLSVGFNNGNNYQLLDGTTGLIPDARISSNFAQDADVVHKTGDETIDGTKTFSGTGWITEIQNTDVTYNIAPSSAKETSIVFTDKNGTQMGVVECSRLTDNSTVTQLNVYDSNGNWSSHPLQLRVFPDGNTTAFAPPSDFNGSILTTVNKSKAANGYFQLGNGLIVNWGKTDSITVASSTVGTLSVSFSKAYTTTPQVVTTTNNNTTNANYGNVNSGVASVSTTGFTLAIASKSSANTNSGAFWIAIGY
jgi:hypothetical protein